MQDGPLDLLANSNEKYSVYNNNTTTVLYHTSPEYYIITVLYHTRPEYYIITVLYQEARVLYHYKLTSPRHLHIIAGRYNGEMGMSRFHLDGSPNGHSAI